MNQGKDRPRRPRSSLRALLVTVLYLLRDPPSKGGQGPHLPLKVYIPTQITRYRTWKSGNANFRRIFFPNLPKLALKSILTLKTYRNRLFWVVSE